jgi:hypothetical protein
MSQENVKIVRRMNAARNRRDRDAILAYYQPDAEGGSAPPTRPRLSA